MEMTSSNTPVISRRFATFATALSVTALGGLGWLLLVHQSDTSGVDLRFVPAINAGLNGTAASLLALGWFAIRRQNRELHRRLMVMAFIASSLFLVGYVSYHYAHGDTSYEGTGTARTVYFAVLISHVLLSMGIVPGSLFAFYFAWRKRFEAHKRVTRILLPAWLYVSVTGVVIYFMLHG